MPDRFVIACGPQHPMLKKHSVTWHKLFQSPWLPPPVGSSARTTFDSLAMVHGGDVCLSPVVTRVTSLTWAMLRRQDLLTLVPFGVVRQWVEVGELGVIEPPEPLPFSPVGVVVPLVNQRMASQIFVRFLTQRQWTETRLPTS